jgi:hypothetical protein
MEVCTKLPVSACTDADWFVDLVPARKANVNDVVTLADYPAGTTAIAPTPELQRFPRRVAFQRNRPTNDDLLLAGNNPTPLGVTAGTNQVIAVSAPNQTRQTANSLWFATTAASGGDPVTYGAGDFPYVFNRSRIGSTGQVLPLLAATSAPQNPPPNTSFSASQPLLIPVLQTQTVGPPGPENNPPQGGVPVQQTGWIPRAVATTFNLIVGSNDTPSRALGNNVGDFNGGLQNLPRFLESWQTIASNIQGSFIQFNRSAYSTAPYLPILDPGAPQQTTPNTRLLSLFAPPQLTPPPPIPAPNPFVILNPPEAGYRTAIGSIPGGTLGRIPFFTPPIRNWGYDVGLVSQSPDLFTQRFTTPPTKSTPDEFFREVPRNDLWVKTLMCGVLEQTPATKATESLTPAERSQCPPP